MENTILEPTTAIAPVTAQPAATSAAKTIANIGVVEFKESVGASSLQVVRNPKTGLLFISASNGKSYKCEQALDVTKAVEFLVEGGDLNEACMINTRTSNVVASF